jgi:hypothetical protein
MQEKTCGAGYIPIRENHKVREQRKKIREMMTKINLYQVTNSFVMSLYLKLLLLRASVIMIN